MVSHAQQLQAEHLEPMQQALAAAAAAAGGDAAARVEAGGGVDAGLGGDVERRVRQVMVETAASAEQLQAAAAALEGV
jgi:hypothetical protein